MSAQCNCRGDRIQPILFKFDRKSEASLADQMFFKFNRKGESNSDVQMFRCLDVV